MVKIYKTCCYILKSASNQIHIILLYDLAKKRKKKKKKKSTLSLRRPMFLKRTVTMDLYNVILKTICKKLVEVVKIIFEKEGLRGMITYSH